MKEVQRIDLTDELKDMNVWSKIIKRYLNKGKHLGFLTEPDRILNTLTDYTWEYPTRILIPKDNGKMREIFKFNSKDSFLLKAINDVFYKHFNKFISKSVYSYRERCRIEHGATYVQNVFRRGNYYGIKLDISNYFMNISNEHITKIIDSLVKDTIGRTLLYKLFNLNGFYDGYDAKEVTKEYLGIIPGSALSSFLANYALHEIDDFLENNCNGYVRYSDDLIFFCSCKEEAFVVLNRLTSMLNAIGLDINPSKVEDFGFEKKVTFLGLEVTPEGLELPSKIINKIKRLIRLEINKFRFEKRNEEALTKLIYDINKKLYGVYMNNAKYMGLVEFYFLNTTSVKEILNIDFYLKDRLRQFYTKSNNKGNIKKCPNTLLKSCGYIPILYLRDMRLENVDLYRTYMFKHLNKFKPKKQVEVSYKQRIPEINDWSTAQYRGVKTYGTHYEFLSRILDNPIGYIPYMVSKDKKTLTLIEDVKGILNYNSYDIYVNCIFDKNKDFKLKVCIDFESIKDTEKLMERAVTHFNSLTLSEFDHMYDNNIRYSIKNYRFFKPSFFKPFINVEQCHIGLSLKKRFLLFESCIYTLKKLYPDLVKEWRGLKYISIPNLDVELPNVIALV